jgi:hypothetical protein
MSLKNIVIIVLRLFSLYWLLTGIFMILTTVATMSSHPLINSEIWSFSTPVIMLFLGGWLFLLAQPIAHIVTPTTNDKLSLGGLSVFDLYCFAFTFLGLYFALSSIAKTFSWIHYFFIINHFYDGVDPSHHTSFYNLTESLITLVAGGMILIFAPRFARKLTELQHKQDNG